ncbi:GNAT family N-acetyltransferase [Streptomyces sp. C11-1]|uniref:GNAT family N-acetyltransferase n=1 Tax=Streptomyces durocortorensis TaxID=2811104 RepID=A0ABY9VVZ0_9ACTN|nr:GNAT family N-acetyltransferase [Streptomyces durocortorensis]WNF28099.1 GNAT family N-acetyltransferase [Streptomyces durocortorensis]
MGHDALRIRRIVEDDWSGITELEARTYTGSALSEEQEALKSRARASPETCFLLEHGRRTVGYVLALPYPFRRYPDLGRAEDTVFRSANLHLHDCVVAEEFRRRGWGTRLIDHLSATAGSRSYERISLIAVGGSDTFWSARGYAPHTEVGLPPGYGEDAVYMSMAVSSPARGASRKNEVS